ncbi:MAG: hypothetical protein NXI17_23620 [Alphaproteobacteria bacterium]|nr:hypothetical protein [Alphaproteobacteria bacterium]
MTQQTLGAEMATIHAELVAMRDESRTSRKAMKDEIDQIKTDVSAMKLQSAKWKGGIAVLAGVGGFFVIALTVFEKLSNAFKG